MSRRSTYVFRNTDVVGRAAEQNSQVVNDNGLLGRDTIIVIYHEYTLWIGLSNLLILIFVANGNGCVEDPPADRTLRSSWLAVIVLCCCVSRCCALRRR